LEEAEEARTGKRLELVRDKSVSYMKAEKSSAAVQVTPSEKETKVDPVFDAYTNDEAWWKELQAVVKAKISVKQSGDDGEKAAKQKNDEEMTKLLCTVSQSFEVDQLPFEYARSIDLMLVGLRQSFLLGIIRTGDYQEVLPNLMGTASSQQCFSRFMRVQFNAAIIAWLQVGQRREYGRLKETMKDVFAFCEQSSNQVTGSFISEFLVKDILQAGAQGVKDFRANKVKKLTDYFNNEENAVNGLNPYLLRFVASYLVKKDSSLLRDTKNCLATLINLHLCCVIYFQDPPLTRKLLKSALKLISFGIKNCQTLAKAGEITAIVQNKLVKLVTSGIDYSDESTSENKRLTAQQLLFLEIHLQIDAL